jgi:glycerate kinase
MQVLIAPNAFKHALDARAAAMAIAEGIQQVNNNFITTIFPVGDGGDGTGRLLTEHCGGAFITTETIDPLGRGIESWFGLIDNGKTAVIEMAAASGLHLLRRDELDPLKAGTYGTGIQISQALDKGVQKIILCVGGSATVDGGTGILRALGIRFLDEDDNALSDLPASLPSLEKIDHSKIDPRIHATEIIILCDVKNKLLGDQGAAAVFGPQKGASANDVEQLELGLTRFSEIIRKEKGIDISAIVHGGAAGGTAAGLYALFNAKLVNGIDHFLDLTGFDSALVKADIVITGEGGIDLQTLDGKAPYGVASRAKKKGIPVIALGGSIDTQNEQVLAAVFDQLICINLHPVDIATALAATRANLVNTGRALAMRFKRS